MPIYALGDVVPDIHPDAYIHPEAVVIGNVTIGADASIWPNSTLRGDFGAIVIGARTSIQDGTVVHTTTDSPTLIGPNCVVGHNAYVEGCELAEAVLVGSLAAVLPFARLGRDVVVAAGAVVTRGTIVPDRALARGVPAQIVENATPAGRWADGVERYVQNARRFRDELRRID